MNNAFTDQKSAQAANALEATSKKAEEWAAKMKS